jgi:hypothetical protein
VGKEVVKFHTTPKNSLHSLMNCKWILVDTVAVSGNMIIGSTSYPLKDIHKSTWRSPDGVTFNQKDHLLMYRRHKSILMDVRSYRGANIDSRHYLVVARLRAQISNVKKVTGIRTSKYNISDIF